MNFIVSIFLSLMLSVLSFVLSVYANFSSNTLINNNTKIAFIVIGVIIAITTIVFIFTAIFQTMVLRKDQKHYFVDVKRKLKVINLKKKELIAFKEEIAESVTELYPNYEKEIFKTISPDDEPALKMYMVKYPELKFSGILSTFLEKISKLTKNIYNAEENLQRKYGLILKLHDSDWYMFKVPIPADIQEGIEFKIEE